MNKKEKIIIFSLIFILLGFFARKLGLYLDDANGAFPIVDNVYLDYALGCLRDYGFFRALAQVYYFSIYSLYLRSSWLAHLVPIFLFLLSGGLIYKVLRLQKLTSKVGFACVLFILSLPFWTEAYVWFSASVGILVYLLFFLQVYLIEKNPLSRKTLILVFLIQLVSTFLYESTILMPVSLAFLWLTKQDKNLSFGESLGQYLKTLSILLIPAFLYLGVRIFFPPQVETRVYFSLNQVFDNWLILLKNLSHLFSYQAFGSLWFREYKNGAIALSQSLISMVIFILLTVIIFSSFYLFKTKQENEYPRERLSLFWLLTFFLSLVPFSLQPEYVPFRLLILPSALMIICLATLLEKRRETLLKKFLKGPFLLLTMTLFIIQVGMITSYTRQFNDDKKMAKEIERKTKRIGFDYNNRTNLYLKNFSLSNTISLPHTYGDYLYSAFHYNWSAEPFYGVYTGILQNTAIESLSTARLSARFTKDELLQLRPLVIMEFQGEDRCHQGECFEITSVLR